MKHFILITGSRDWTDSAAVEEALQAEYERAGAPLEVVVMHGACRGADKLATMWADLKGFEVIPIPASDFGQWPACGPRRNSAMVNIVSYSMAMVPQVTGSVLAFPMPDSRGTWDCVGKALRKRIPVKINWSCIPGGAWLPAESSSHPPMPPLNPPKRLRVGG